MRRCLPAQNSKGRRTVSAPTAPKRCPLCGKWQPSATAAAHHPGVCAR